MLPQTNSITIILTNILIILGYAQLQIAFKEISNLNLLNDFESNFCPLFK